MNQSYKLKYNTVTIVVSQSVVKYGGVNMKLCDEILSKLFLLKVDKTQTQVLMKNITIKLKCSK